MNFSVFQLNASVLGQWLSFYGLTALVAAAIAGGIGLLVAQQLERMGVENDAPHGWLHHLPVVGLLALGAIMVAGSGWSFIVSAVVLGLLLVPTVGVMLFRYRDIKDDDHLDVRLDQRHFLRTGWYDTAYVLAGYLVFGLVVSMIPSEMQSLLAHASVDILIAVPIGMLGGLALGTLLSRLRDRLVAIEEARRKANTLGTAWDSLVGTGQELIESVLTQFHGTSLTGVLLILAATTPFTSLSTRVVLAVLAIPSLSSAMLAGLLTEDPAPDQPGFWAHLRKGVNNTGQMATGYLIGILLLVPLDLVHAWVQAEPDQVMVALGTHLELTFVALGISLVLGLAGGILSSRFDVLRTILTNLGNVGRTIPSLAVLALALPIFGVGFRPSLVALIFIGALPILINTTIGIIEVSAQIKEAARGMGFNDRQVLFQVELPIALPVIMAGIRTSAVLVVASATLAGFIGGGGLGDLIIRGDGSGRTDILFTGAILATILSIFLEYLFAWLEALLTPRGLRN